MLDPKELIGGASEERLRRKEDQAWEMAGLARQDRDMADAARRTQEARDWRALRVELYGK